MNTSVTDSCLLLTDALPCNVHRRAGTILAISILFIVKSMMQVINSGLVLFHGNKNRGGFAAMLLLESVLEHAQPWVLVIALFFDPNFTSVLLKLLHQVCPICCRPKVKLTCDLVRNPHVLDSVPPAASDSDDVLN